MEQPTRQPEVKEKDEISLKELILKLQDLVSFLLRKWLLILIAGIVGAGLGLFYSSTRKPVFLAELTFVLEDSKSSSLGAYSSIASQFGIDVGGSSGVGVFSADNILTFLKSRLMVEKTLLSPVQYQGKEMSFADLYIQVNNFRKGWEKNPELAKISFPVNPDRSKFTIVQDSLLNMIYESIVKNDLQISKPDKKGSFITVASGSLNEVYAKEFTIKLVDEATTFYIDTKTKRSKTNVDMLQAKADSLEILLNRKVYSAAVSKDLNLNPARSVASVQTEVMTRDKALLQTVYAEVVKNLELSRMSMAQETPLIQIIDSPILPLKRKKFGWAKGIFFGGLLGGFVVIGTLVGRKIYRDIMA